MKEEQLDKTLRELLDNHKKWIENENGGEQIDLSNCDLTEAKLTGVNLCVADLKEANFYRADLQEAYLRDADLRGAHLDKADLRYANLYDTKIEEDKENYEEE